MIRPAAVQARERYRLWLKYADGSAGEVDLSHLVGSGVFIAWKDPERFEQVRIAPHGAIAWEDDIELCPDALYLALTGKSVEDVMPGVRTLTQGDSGVNGTSKPSP